ncbi:hypothetical protein [Moraxella oblonga]|uniref:hypothetical protein n=1 Tax=Moraxella oblonga TaxID=200413 RepID=UPI000831A2E9|nr:hypothetical protein [Moraxella oblonga]
MNDSSSPQKQLTILKNKCHKIQLDILENRIKQDETTKQTLDDLNKQIHQINNAITKSEFANAKDIKAAFEKKKIQIQQKQNTPLYPTIIGTMMKDLSLDNRYQFCEQLLILQEHFNKLHQEQCQRELMMLQEIYERVKKERREFYINEGWIFVAMVVVGVMFLGLFMVFGNR